MSKVYVIGAKDTDMQRIREITETDNDVEVVLIDSMSEIPMEDRHKNIGVKEIIPFISLPRFEPSFYSEKRKSHERPYKFHK